MDRTEIICTIGPKTKSKESICRLARNGMTTARVNLSHASIDDINEIIDAIAYAEGKLNKKIKLALDTEGPELRINFPKNITIEAKDSIVLSSNKFFKETQEFESGKSGPNPKIIFTDDLRTEDYYNESKIDGFDALLLKNDTKMPRYALVANHDDFKTLKIGDSFSIGDPKVPFIILKNTNEHILAKCLRTGTFFGRKKLTIPDCQFKKILTRKDKSCIKECKKFNQIFISFCQSKEDVLSVKELIETRCLNENIKLIAKIETEKAVRNIDEIVEVVDGIMIARGDLCLNIGIDKLYSTQKYLIRKVKEFKRDKNIIMATEMMASMETKPYPTRAEINDVGSAVLNGCNAVMLSGETATGDYPLECVAHMRAICRDAENYMDLEEEHGQFVFEASYDE